MWTRKKSPLIVIPKTELSPALKEVWGFVNVHVLILATPGFIVFLDEALDVDWKSTDVWDDDHRHQREQMTEVLNGAAELEADDWDKSDVERTINFRRQIGEAIARALDGNFQQARQMLDKATAYRKSVRRRQSIGDQVAIKEEWRRSYKIWISIHYGLGIGALVLSTLVASRIGFNEVGVSILAWLVALFAGLLTFLTPDKKADRYLRAWSALNSEIARYNSDETHTLDDVLQAYERGENIIFETGDEKRRSRR